MALVGADVVENHVQVKVCGHDVVDASQKVDELRSTMALPANADDSARFHVESCEQRRGAVTDVVVRPPLR